MLVNLSNHPQAKWSAAQRNAAERDYGEIVDLPFPNVDPRATLDDVQALAHGLVERCLAQLASASSVCSAVHVMGEFTLTYCLVREFETRGIPCLASTTERAVINNRDGTSTTRFDFVAFRPYFESAKEDP